MRFFRKKTLDLTNVAVPVERRDDLKFQGDMVDLRQSKNQDRPKQTEHSSETNAFNFLNSMVSSSNTSNQSSFESNEILELKKSLRATTSRIEDNSNEIYRLLQKIELLERKIERLENGR